MGLAKPLDDPLSEDDTSNETPPAERPEELRLTEALLFAAGEPLDEKTLRSRLPEGVDIAGAMRRLQAEYAPRGVNLVRIAGKWTFRTANDLAWLLARDSVEPKKLSRAANETLAIIAYHQPVTRAEIEDIRGVTVSKGTIDVLMETGWIRPRGRRKAPGRPLTFGTTQAFLEHFGLEAIGDLPGLDELKGTGLLDGRLPAGFSVPLPSDDAALREDEDPLDRKSTRLNSSHGYISYAVFCLTKTNVNTRSSPRTHDRTLVVKLRPGKCSTILFKSTNGIRQPMVLDSHSSSSTRILP